MFSENFRRKYLIFVLVSSVAAFFTFSHIIPLLASPPTSPYSPGETLDPSCSPSDLNCTVSPPIFGTGILGRIMFWDASSSASSTGNFFWDPQNLKLGIGTSTPTSSITISAASPSLLISDTEASGKIFSLRNGIATSGVFDIFSNSSSVSRLAIDAAGRVGIGTTTPQSALVLSAANPTITLKNTIVGLGTSYQIRNGLGGASTSSLDIFDATNNASRIFFDTSGRVSMGSTTPPSEAKVFVYGGPSGANVDVRSEDATEPATLEVQSYDYSTTFKAAWLQYSSAGVFGTYLGGITLADSGRLVFQGASTSAVYSDTGALIFGSHNVERMRLTASGTIGIATTTPKYALVVGNGTAQSDISIPKGSLCVDVDNSGCPASPTAGVIYASSTSITGIDIAENYPTTDISIEAGDVVSMDPQNPENIIKASDVTRNGLMGVISTAPGVLLGRKTENARPVGLSGRVPVKVNMEGGAITIGDPLTVSSIAGVAKKATTSGRIIGYALHNFSGIQQGKIIVFLNPGHWSAPEQVAAQSWSPNISLLDSLREFGMYLRDGILEVKNIITEVISAKKVVTENLEIKDRSSGEIYCVGLRGGEWEKTLGECGASAPIEPTPVELPLGTETETSDPTIADVATTTIITTTTITTSP